MPEVQVSGKKLDNDTILEKLDSGDHESSFTIRTKNKFSNLEVEDSTSTCESENSIAIKKQMPVKPSVLNNTEVSSDEFLLSKSDFDFDVSNNSPSTKDQHSRSILRKERRNRKSQKYNICTIGDDIKENGVKEPRKGDRLLNPANQNDRRRLFNMREKLEQLKNIATDRRKTGELADSFKIYKEIKTSGVNLYTQKDVKIKAGNQILISLNPKFSHLLGDKVWMAHPYKNLKNHIDFQNHTHLSILPTIIDKSVTEKRCICVRNIGTADYFLPKGTLLCQAKELYYSFLPQMDSNLVAEIDRYQETENKASENEENFSPKKKAEIEFDEAIEKIQDPEIRKFIEENRKTFIQSHEYLLDKINMPPIQLGTKNGEVKPTPPPGRRHFSEKHDAALSVWAETSLLNGLISRIQSDTVSPLHCVEQNGKLRIVMDSRKVNEQLSLYNYIFPKISEDIEELSSGKFTVFSQTDLTGAFNQIEVHPDSRFLLAFSLYTKKYRGVFAYNRLPFGIKSAPSIFASVLDNALTKINAGSDGKFLIKSFIDDIVIGAVDKNSMFQALRCLFFRLNYYNFKLSLKKSDFFTDKVSYCGIEVNKDGYCISEKRKKILRDYPDFDVRSRKKNADLSHLGFYNWHRRFVKNYSMCDRKIRETIRNYKDKIIKADAANDIIKKITDEMKAQILSCMLITPDKEDEITLQCDASGKSWGYVCYCDRGVFAYGGGSFSPTVSRSHNIFELEAKGMSNSLSDVYKLISQGKRLIIKNDNLSLIKVNKTNKTIVTPRIIKYMQNIAMIAGELPTDFVHLGTLENYMADVLSRLEYNDDGTIRICFLSQGTGDSGNFENMVASLHQTPILDSSNK